MSKVKIRLEDAVRELTTLKGHKFKVVDLKMQCGMGDCLCTFGFHWADEDQDKEKGLISVDLCEHHKDIE